MTDISLLYVSGKWMEALDLKLHNEKLGLLILNHKFNLKMVYVYGMNSVIWLAISFPLHVNHKPYKSPFS